MPVGIDQSDIGEKNSMSVHPFSLPVLFWCSSPLFVLLSRRQLGKKRTQNCSRAHLSNLSTAHGAGGYVYKRL